MNENFKIKVNNTTEFNITNKEASALDSVKTSDSKFHILQNNNPYKAEIIEADFNTKSYVVKVNNNSYSIKIENDLDTLIKSMGFEVGASKIVNDIKAPMPGLILDIMVKVGDQISMDSPLLILEAMKMENSILSPRDGIIKSVSGIKGNTVDKGELLIEFE
ncbi:acetyl-CoA carboxylase biotin carboxyl carrier protein subunit [Lacinutrix sp. Bg11-31]|uniref:acetyl-CoA carboxylase biotin carboxyl carrier protein subunit n=1 Tax=Lacinutrix sp. Bg11-31 TaxID=2057808 RepID=UPI000C2FF42C|nr:acetyl-CoA carboxylase biotin carboxyl carrier protein subunit [Lacinutrix sp. Bg11-31]AUC81704.1 acetyl-CoA carboxylase biotin carboxyl carrier protein subunit [Lacinutrix sp. Bg11-31]